VLARDKDVLLDVLKEEGVPFVIFGKHSKSMKAKVAGTFALVRNYLKIARRFHPDVIVSKASFYGCCTARLIGCKSVVFPDSEVVKLTNRYVVPLCTRVVTPQSFKLDYGSKHQRVKGIFEDCYLSPAVYQPDPAVADRFGLKRPFAVVRFVGWQANHDVGNNGFTLEQKKELVSRIAAHETVYISSEKNLPAELEPYRLPTPASLIHDVLSAADLYVGDSQTMAAEAALLGTPAIRSNSFVGPRDMSNFIMLQNDYQLLINIASPAEAIEKAEQMAAHSQKEAWRERREKYYSHTGNINDSIVSTLENL